MLENELISIGEISGVFGVKGWIKIYSHTDPRENILKYSPWMIKKGKQTKEVEIVSGKRQGKSIVASIKGVTDRDVAATYSGWEILINKNQLPKPKAGEYYWLDLVGLDVETDLGIRLGTVDYLIETGANDVLVVKDKEQERLIPFIQEQTIKKIDLDDNLIIVDWDPDF